MYFLTNDERRLISARLLPEIRNAGVADELRGWNWARAPLAPLYDGKLTVAEVTAQTCATARDLYLRHVLGYTLVAAAPSSGSTLRAALRSIVTKAKLIIYEHGPACLPALAAFVDAQTQDVDLINELAQFGFGDPALWQNNTPPAVYAPNGNTTLPTTALQAPQSSMANNLAQAPQEIAASATQPKRRKQESQPGTIPLSMLKQFEARRILQATEQALLANPKIGVDALASSVLPVTVGYELDGSLLGLRKRQSVDMLQLGTLAPLLIRFGRRSDNHRLTTTGYALIAESLLERPVDIGCIVYVGWYGDQLTIDRDLHVINDELRQEFIELRDERMRLLEEEIDPGLAPDCEDRCTMPGRCRRNM